jgi:hypothetical protein
VPSLSAGELARILEEPTLRPVLTRQLRDAVWFTGQFPSVLREIARFRNPAAHSEPVGPDDAVRLRDHMVGVGCHGHLVQLARVQPL